MVYLYLGVLGAVALGTFLSIFLWIFLLGSKNIVNNLIGQIPRFLVFLILYFIGTWFWIYFNLPNIVSIFWYFLVLNIILGGISLFIAYVVENGGFSGSSQGNILNILGMLSFLILFISLDRIIPILFSLPLYASLLLGSIKLRDILSGQTNANSITQVFKVEKTMQLKKIRAVLLLALFLLPIIIGVNLFFYYSVDRAEYFDASVQTAPTDLPFKSKMDGEMLRVVDFDLAQSIMKKSNRLGSNTLVTDIHLGDINGSTYWIGAVLFDGDTFIRQDLNHYQGFIGVDFKDPDHQPIIIEQNFFVGKELSLDNKMSRVIYNFNPNYIPGDNSYFTLGSDGKMRLMVPYSIRASPLFQGVSGAGIVTQELYLKGGVLEIKSDKTVTDYQDLTTLPHYARVQYYSETWLKDMVGSWGSSITSISPSREFGLLTSYGGIFKSPWKMGIDDDVRVVIDPDTRENVQYFLLESTGSDNQVLRGAMKANSTGIYFYDWSEYGFIDSTAAKNFAETEITNQLDTTTHGYETLLPLLYPIRDNPQSMDDYAYVIPLQFQGVRFGGVVILDPSDKTGSHNAIKIVSSEGANNITKVIDEAIDAYFSGSSGAPTGDLAISSTVNYVTDGNSIFVLSGNFSSSSFNATIDVVFEQGRITDQSDWIKVVTARPGGTITISIVLESGVYYAVDVL